jgi:hypothetical protein
MKVIVAVTAIVFLAVATGCGYDACAGKSCGDHCNPCAPDSSFCIHLTSSSCDKNGDCKDDNGYPPTCQ